MKTTVVATLTALLVGLSWGYLNGFDQGRESGLKECAVKQSHLGGGRQFASRIKR